MEWAETVASGARYGYIAGRIFEGDDVICEVSEDGYQGACSVIAAQPDGTYVHYEWNCGSCGCDAWEYAKLSDDEIEAEMRRGVVTLSSRRVLERYLAGVEGPEGPLRLDELREAYEAAMRARDAQ